MVKLTCKFPTVYNVSLIVLEHYLLDFNWYRAITQCTSTVNVLTIKPWIKIVRKGIPTRRSNPSALFGACLLWPNGRPSQLLLSSCLLRWWLRLLFWASYLYSTCQWNIATISADTTYIVLAYGSPARNEAHVHCVSKNFPPFNCL